MGRISRQLNLKISFIILEILHTNDLIHAYQPKHVFQFQMTVVASDQRSPPKLDRAILFVHVIPNLAPFFTNLDANTQASTVEETVPLAYNVYKISAVDPDIGVCIISIELTYALHVLYTTFISWQASAFQT